MKVRFENFWSGFPKEDNIVTCALRQLGWTIEITNGDANIVIHQGPRQSKDPYGLTVCWFVESMERIGVPDYSYCDYSIGSCYHDDYRHLRIPFWATQINWNSAPRHDMNRGPTLYIDPEELTEKKVACIQDRPCCSVASGTLGKRRDFYPKISQKIDVTHGGDFLRNTDELVKKPGNSDYLEKVKFIARFNANLCFENSDYPGYVCEKILHAFYAGCLPIYWGPKDVIFDFNPEAFINIDNFESDDEAIDYIKRVLGDKRLLLDYLYRPIFKNNKFPIHATPVFVADHIEYNWLR